MALCLAMVNVLLLTVILHLCGSCNFGLRCTYECHCEGGVTCNRDTGECPTGCDDGVLGFPYGYSGAWSGYGCQLGNQAFFKPATQSPSTYPGFVASRAVDGNHNPDIFAGHCAHPTGGAGEQTWWQVDLGREYVVVSINITNRVEPLQMDRLTNTVIEVSLDGVMYSNCFMLGPDIGDPLFIYVTCITRIMGRYVQLRRLPGSFESHAMNICEVQVYAYQYNDCPDGYHGIGCGLDCGSCLNNEPCHDITGVCPTGCDPGKMGDLCVEDCPDGYHGIGCGLDCGSCLNNEPCHDITGVCPTGCDPGKMGDLCVEDCPIFRWGAGCNNSCECPNISDACDAVTGCCLNSCQQGIAAGCCDVENSTGAGDSMVSTVKPASSGLSSGATAGMAVGIILVVALVIVAVLLWRLKPNFIRKSRERQEPTPRDRYATEGGPDTFYSDIEEGRLGKPVSMDNMSAVMNIVKGSTYGFQSEFNELKRSQQTTHQLDQVHEYEKLKHTYEKEATAHIAKVYGSHRKHYVILLGNRLSRRALWQMVYRSGADNIIAFGLELKQRLFREGGYGAGELSISTDYVEEYSDYLIQHVMLTMEGCRRRIRVFIFFTWEEGTIPLNAAAIVDFQRKLRQTESAAEAEIVLCSDKLDRSGPFVAIDYCLHEAAAENKVDVFRQFVHLLSSCSDMEITKEQYGFVYDAILEHWESRDTGFPVTKFCANQDSGGVAHSKSLFEKMDRWRGVSSPDEHNYSGHQFPDKNRNSNIIPADSLRPILQNGVDEMDDYINAVYVNSYRKQNAVIATQAPMSGTIQNFWRMVYDCNVRMIVTLNEIDGGMPPYWPIASGTTLSVGSLAITHQEETVQGGTTTRLFVLKGEDKEEFEVTQFQLTNWPDDEDTPENCDVLLRVLQKVQVAALTQATSPVVMHCRDGAQKTGLCCAAMFLIDQIQASQVVDIFHAVRRVQASRPQFIISQAQLVFLHRFAKEFIESNQEYANQ